MKSDFVENLHLMTLGRLVALIDGVFAVAMTLLILDLRLSPQLNLIPGLEEMLPGFLVYLITFASIVGYWFIHHANFRYVSGTDARLVLLSLVSMLFVTLFPVCASIVGAHPLEPIATVCMSANSLGYCVSMWALWSYAAANRRLLAEGSDPGRLHDTGRIMGMVAVGLALAIPLAFLSVYIAYAIWILYPPAVGWGTRGRKGPSQRPPAA
jgi:uncharacterized membrane protein